MRCAQAALMLWGMTALAAEPFSGPGAMAYVNKALAFGPRPSGSPANQQLQTYLQTELRRLGWQVSADAFTATTPAGAVAMRNVIAKKPGTSGQAIVLTSHFDTKVFPFRFVGANDGGSSTGLLLEMAKELGRAPRKDDLYLVFLDGEEAVKEWSATDSLYGSRHLAQKWAQDGTLARVKALINVDMIGDAQLDVLEDENSSADLRRLVGQTAADLGYGRFFYQTHTGIEDDHLPFLRLGVRVVDLIDFNYGPNHRYWHTAEDTADKLSPDSLQVVGRVLMEVVRKLETLYGKTS